MMGGKKLEECEVVEYLSRVDWQLFREEAFLFISAALNCWSVSDSSSVTSVFIVQGLRSALCCKTAL